MKASAAHAGIIGNVQVNLSKSHTNARPRRWCPQACSSIRALRRSRGCCASGGKCDGGESADDRPVGGIDLLDQRGVGHGSTRNWSGRPESLRILVEKGDLRLQIVGARAVAALLVAKRSRPPHCRWTARICRPVAVPGPSYALDFRAQGLSPVSVPGFAPLAMFTPVSVVADRAILPVVYVPNLRPRPGCLRIRAVATHLAITRYRLLLQKLEDQLRLLVGLRQHRDTRLFQHLGLGQVRRFLREVRILNGAARLGQVLARGLSGCSPPP